MTAGNGHPVKKRYVKSLSIGPLIVSEKRAKTETRICRVSADIKETVHGQKESV